VCEILISKDYLKENFIFSKYFLRVFKCEKIVKMNYELGCVNKKYRKWLSVLGCFLICLVYGSITTISNMSPYIISYIRECDKEVNIRYSVLSWSSLLSSSTLKITALLTGFVFSLKIKLDLKVCIFFGCCIFRLKYINKIYVVLIHVNFLIVFN